MTLTNLILVHLPDRSRWVTAAAEIYYQEADGGDPLDRGRSRVREIEPRDESRYWEVVLEPPVNKMLPVSGNALDTLRAAYA